jgi:hypothetical protein
MPRGVALGMILEIAKAGLAPKWETEMLTYMKDAYAVHPDVFEFYTMGDHPTDPLTPNEPFIQDDPLERPPMKIFFDVVESLVTTKRVITADGFNLRVCPVPREPGKAVRDIEDFSTRLDEITLQWSWGMKFLFQAFAVRDDEDNNWCLWPFAQPNFNNRHIAPDLMWNHNENTETFMSVIFEKQETNLESQPAYSVPYEACPDEDEGLPLVAMLEGMHGKDTLTFDDLRARKCSVWAMEKCFKAIMVGSSISIFCVHYYLFFLTHA